MRVPTARVRSAGVPVPARCWALSTVRGRTVPGTFVETFWWDSPGSAQLAHDNSEVQELWMRVEDLCVQGGVQHRALRLLD